MSYTAEEVSERIRKVLGDRHWKEADLAKAAGKPRATINRAISGKRRPEYDTLKAIADATGVSINYFTGEEEPEDFLDPDIKSFFQYHWSKLDPDDKNWLRGTIEMLRKKSSE